MNRRERLMATLNGRTVDRPPVSFYEINGLDEDPDQADPFNIYNDPSWRPLIELARDKTDRIVMRSVSWTHSEEDPFEERFVRREWTEGLCRHGTTTLRAGTRTLTSQWRRDADVNTVWTIEHLLKGQEDLEAYLQLPARPASGSPEIESVLEAEAALGDTGIVMVDTADPLCYAASLFSMDEYTVVAMTEPLLFRRLLDRFAEQIWAQTEAVAQALPGRLWRIVGPEYASPPYLPPRLFREYVCEYVRPMVQSIQRYGGFARIHCHGNLKSILLDILELSPDGLDPIEPPPQGDVELHEVKAQCGDRVVLFGNLEASDLETLPTERFAEKVSRAIAEGTEGGGRGFVLMPSACPYGRKLSRLALSNYETMVELIEKAG